MASESVKKVMYVHTGLELGEIHEELRDTLYVVWQEIPDEQLARFGLKRLDEERTR